MSVTERVLDAPREAVFAVLTDPETYPEWLTGAKRIREVSPGWPSPGSSFKHVVGFGPIEIPDSTTVREIEPPHRFVLLVRARPVVEAVVQFELEAAGARCLLRMTEDPVGVYRFIAPIANPLVRSRNERSLNCLESVIRSRQHRATT